jgi:hypothetical protein
MKQGSIYTYCDGIRIVLCHFLGVQITSRKAVARAQSTSVVEKNIEAMVCEPSRDFVHEEFFWAHELFLTTALSK